MALDDPQHHDRPLYRDRRTERFAHGERVKEFHAFEQQAKKRLAVLLSARYLSDLVLLPSNHLETLGGDRRGQFSIRINRQWRICFAWPEGTSGPIEIEIVDYQ